MSIAINDEITINIKEMQVIISVLSAYSAQDNDFVEGVTRDDAQSLVLELHSRVKNLQGFKSDQEFLDAIGFEYDDEFLEELDKETGSKKDVKF